MKATRNAKWSIGGLVLLAVVAVALSAAAVMQYRGGTAEPAPLASPSYSESEGQPTPEPSPTDEPPESPSSEPESPEPTESASEEPSESESPDVAEGPLVVVIGDTYSTGDVAETWIGPTAEALGWGEVINLSSPGRGYSASPRECDFEPCANLPGTIPAIADLEPDVVVTFAGTGDGDYSLADATTGYYDSLREALPDAELVAISPVTTEAEAPYWLTLHRQSIQAAIEAVGGTLVDVGQPGVGDGEALSAEAQQQISQTVVEGLGD